VIEVQVTTRAGDHLRVAAKPGLSLMEALCDNGVDEVLALCGGCCACATCHVYVESGPEGSDTAGSADEDDVLDSSNHRRANSRLSCQLALAAEHDGMKIRIAPED
jgi:ferredoxin